MEKISFVIPCFKSEKTIETVVGLIKKYMESEDYEIILVNDHSPDAVWDVICRLASDNSRIKGVNLPRNFGQHSALMAGYGLVTGDTVVSLDDDGQTPVEELGKMLVELEKGYDVVYAEYNEIKQNAFRRWGSKVNGYMTEHLIDKPKSLTLTSYFVAKRFVIEEIIKYQGPYPYIQGLILRATSNITNVKVNQHERLNGKSGYNMKSLVKLWLNGFTAFSVKPLRLATIMGIICATIGFGYAIYVIIHKLLSPNVPVGYSSIFSALLLIGGAIMVLLGMIGEYIGRIYINVNSSPQYVISEIVNYKNDEQDEQDI